MELFKKFGFISLMMVIIVSLAACGGSKQNAGGSDTSTPAATDSQPASTEQPSAEPSADQGGDQQQVTITYAHGKDVTGATQKLIDAFEKEHPNIKVNFRELPNDSGQQHDQYVTMFNAGSSDVDVFDIDVVWPAEMAQAGYLLPLDNFLEQDNVNLDAYIPGAVDAASFNGKQWALPRFVDAGMLFYRKDLVPTPPATWDDLVQAAEANKGKGGTKFGYVLQAKQYEGLVCNAVEFIASYGGSFYDDKGNVSINSPEAIKGLNMMKKIVTSDFVPQDITTYTETETDNATIAGSTVFTRNWPYQYAEAQDASKSKVVDKIGIAPLPKGDAGSAAALGGWLSAINKNSQHKQEAWEFLKFITGPEGEKISALVGGAAPTLLDLYNDADIKANNPIFADPGFVAGVSAAVSRPVTPTYQKISDIIQTEVSKFLAGNQSAEDAVKAMETQMKAANPQ